MSFPETGSHCSAQPPASISRGRITGCASTQGYGIPFPLYFLGSHLDISTLCSATGSKPVPACIGHQHHSPQGTIRKQGGEEKRRGEGIRGVEDPRQSSECAVAGGCPSLPSAPYLPSALCSLSHCAFPSSPSCLSTTTYHPQGAVLPPPSPCPARKLPPLSPAALGSELLACQGSCR